jgi:hypothetical protein
MLAGRTVTELMKSGEERVRLDAAKYYTARRIGWKNRRCDRGWFALLDPYQPYASGWAARGNGQSLDRSLLGSARESRPRMAHIVKNHDQNAPSL